MRRPIAQWLCCVVLACCLGQTIRAESAGESPGMADFKTIAQRLYANLDAREQSKVSQDLILPDTQPRLLIQPCVEGGVARIRVSPTTIELIDRVSLALAINKFEKGYLGNYLVSLARYTPGQPIPPLQDAANPRYAKLEVVNEHLSNFNQISGGLISIALSQQQLGFANSKRGNVDLWMKALKLGAKSSVACAFGVEGLADFYDALDKMPTRPKWVEEFLPEGVKTRKVRRELEKVSQSLLEQ